MKLLTIDSIFVSVMPSILVGIFMAYFNRKQVKRDKISERRSEVRKSESLLQLELQMATAKLASATAIALKRGHANGEVEEGMDAFEQAKKKYTEFLNGQAVEKISGDDF